MGFYVFLLPIDMPVDMPIYMPSYTSTSEAAGRQLEELMQEAQGKRLELRQLLEGDRIDEGARNGL